MTLTFASHVDSADKEPKKRYGSVARTEGSILVSDTGERQAQSSRDRHVAPAHDSHESEADRLAELFVRDIRRGTRTAGQDPSTAPQVGLQARPRAALPGTWRAQQGQPLDPQVRQLMEARVGRDLGDVRIHSNDEAARAARTAKARAFTIGEDVVFARGAYAPSTMEGRRLIAHEVAHVIQQSGAPPQGLSPAAPGVLQRQEDAGIPGGAAAPAAEPLAGEPPEEPHRLSEVRPKEASRVERIVMARGDMRLRLDTTTTAYLYELETCNLPLGSYEAQVTIEGNDFRLTFGTEVGATERFDFSYRVNPGQENPATFLADQATVHVDVVEHLGSAPEPRPPEHERVPECVIRLPDRELVRADSASRPLFPRMEFDQTIWSHTIPLGMYGWVEVSAKATGRLTGTLSGSYGPGRLTDICLTHLTDEETGQAPIRHPLLGRGSQTEVRTYRIGGHAHFHLPARVAIRLAGEGRLRIAGEYLSFIDVAAAEGVLTGSAEASLAGAIDADVGITARATRSRARLEHPIAPASVTIENSKIDAVDLSAEIGLRGRAGLRFRLDLSAGFELAGVNLWRQTWNLVNFDTGVSWAGGLRYSPNPGVHWDLGTLGVGEETEQADDEPIHEDTAEVDQDEIISAILDESDAHVAAPDGLSEANALPFDWFKPLELYPPVLDLPNAEDPKEVHRDAGPTTVRYLRGGRSVYEDIGVADWPAVGRTFEFFPYDPGGRKTPEQGHFNSLLDRLGHDRSGTDAEHVWDVYLRGLEFDRFDNLWPASNQEQQLAGTRHRNQIANYRRTHRNIEGRHFRIVRVRHPA